MPKMLTRKVGPLPVWGWMLGVGILAMVVILLRRPEPVEPAEGQDATKVPTDDVPTFPRAAINDAGAPPPASYDPPEPVSQTPPTATELVRLRAELATAIAQRAAVKAKIDATQEAIRSASGARLAELKARLARYMKAYEQLNTTIRTLKQKIAGLSAISDRATGGRRWHPPSLPGIGPNVVRLRRAAYPSNSQTPILRRPSVIEIPAYAVLPPGSNDRAARPTVIESDRRRRVMPYIPAGR